MAIPDGERRGGLLPACAPLVSSFRAGGIHRLEAQALPTRPAATAASINDSTSILYR
jgi:hypothetical protein